MAKKWTGKCTECNDAPAICRGLCSKHYQARYRAKDFGSNVRVNLTLERRLESRLARIQERQKRADAIVELAEEVSQAATARHYGLSRQAVNQRVYDDHARCRQLCAKSLECGDILKSPRCWDCGAVGRTEAHHPDYSRPFAVEWLCKSCHSKKF